MGSPVVVVPPVCPVALLAHVLEHYAHPTTLVVCSTSTDFVQRCVDDDDGGDSVLHTASLLQVAVARHIRVAFVPTVAHLRGFLAALDLAASRVPAPPAADLLVSSGGAPPPVRRGDHALSVYDVLQLHWDTSEWSSQGLSASAAVLVEAGWRTGLDVMVVDGGSGHVGGPGTEAGSTNTTTTVLDEKTPVLSSGPRRQLQRAGYPLRTERVKAVLARWFSFREALRKERTKVESKVEEEQRPPDSRSQTGYVKVEEAEKTEEVEEVAVVAVEETNEIRETAVEGAEEEPHVDEETVRTVEEKPVKTFVKDSEDEDDDLSDDEAIYP